MSALSFQQWLLVTGFLGFLIALVGTALWCRQQSIHQKRYWQSKLDELQTQLSWSIKECEALDQRAGALQQQLMSAVEEKAGLQGQLSQLARAYELLEQKEQQLLDLSQKNSSLQTQLAHQEEYILQQKELLTQTRKELTQEFEQLSHKIFDEKQRQFQEQSQQNLSLTVSPLRTQLSEFNQQIERLYHNENANRNQLIGKITELQQQTQKIGEDAVNLAAALKGDNKTQGLWGEIILERLLEESGLQKGREYDIQLGYKDDKGSTRNPDVVLYLPENRQLIVDAKVSLTHYERLMSESNLEKQEQLIKSHVDSVKNHIKQLSNKKYDALEGITSVDFVLLFIPIDAAYISALQNEPALFKAAFDQNIVLTSPTTLMATLRTIESIWRFQKQHDNAEKIARQAGGIYDQFALILESLDELGKYLDKTQDSFKQTQSRLTEGRGNLLGRVERLRLLGAKTKKRLPVTAADDVESVEDQL